MPEGLKSMVIGHHARRRSDTARRTQHSIEVFLNPYKPAVLFFLAPFVAEFLLGNLPITMLSSLIVLAPM